MSNTTNNGMTIDRDNSNAVTSLNSNETVSKEQLKPNENDQFIEKNPSDKNLPLTENKNFKIIKNSDTLNIALLLYLYILQGTFYNLLYIIRNY